MSEGRYGVIDLITGEIIRQTNNKKLAQVEANMLITKEMLDNPSEDLIRHMYKIMKTSGKIDRYGMMQIDGLYVGEDFFRIGLLCGQDAANFIQLKYVLSARGFIKQTATTDCHTWDEVMVVLGIVPTNKRAVKRFKKILVDNDVVRKCYLPSGIEVFVVNPNILRHGSHTSALCISTFKDIVLDRVDRYNTYLMYLNGLLEYSDLK